MPKIPAQIQKPKTTIQKKPTKKRQNPTRSLDCEFSPGEIVKYALSDKDFITVKLRAVVWSVVGVNYVLNNGTIVTDSSKLTSLG